ncbi:hypothetical protein NG895_18250 [Aeoliella sp. ICT_H6.2]|uniref:Uncharacterized protein n=1 Tax=Aeoliella straminimaris TaxID=2954799 RepID=A0A9X2FBH8_9BACT|nr:hypothetical protein [Aeoliella straminimaris]MCO6045845.1 hypothetical protein [Aeoliella straminimaris]
MPRDPRNELTIDSLQAFLLRLGFEPLAKVNSSLAFLHSESGTIISLSVPSDGRTVRSADLLSVLTRLDSAGLVNEADIEQFRLGKLPIAS